MMKREKLRLLLVRPDLAGFVLKTIDPPLGILSLSAAVKKDFGDAVEVRLMDLRVRHQNEKSFSETIKAWRPDMIGFSALSAEADRTARLARVARDLHPRAKILVGGPYATSTPLECSEKTGADVVFVGEAERTLCDWLRCLGENGSATELPGLVLRDSDGRPFLTGPAELIEDLDALPIPDWGGIRIEDYHFGNSMNWFNAHKRYASIMTSRGCPYQCIYCHKIFGRKVRFRDLSLVMEEVRMLYEEYGIRELQIVDDIFNVDPERVIEFSRMIQDSGMRLLLSFPNGLRSDILTEEVVDALRSAGTYMMTFAIESASPRIQKMIKKNLDLKKAAEMIRYADRQGIITKAYAMIGFVTETEEEIHETIDFILNLPLLQVSFFMVVPQPNTALYDLTKEFDRDFDLTDVPQYYGNSSQYSEGADYDLPRIQRWAYLRFYFRSGRFFRLLLRVPRPMHFLRLFVVSGIEGLFRIR